VFRIYKDVRFSQDKTLYKTNMGAYIAKEERKSKYAGYYIHLRPEVSFAGNGIYCPKKELLAALRQSIADDAYDFKPVI